MNKVILLGNLGTDSELKYSSAGKPYINFRLATSRKWTAADGSKKEETQWHRVAFFGKSAEAVNGFLTKGRQVLVEGSIKYREHDGKYYTDIEASDVQLIGSAQQKPGPKSETKAAQKETSPSVDEAPAEFDDGIPF